MTIGIYCIRNTLDGKRYIGKSKNIEKRWATHRCAPNNRHLAAAIKADGIAAFEFSVLESFLEIDEKLIADREIHWMDHHKTFSRRTGYNLKRDSSSFTVVHDETKAHMSKVLKAVYANPELRAARSAQSKAAHARPDVKAKHSAAMLRAHARPDVKAKHTAAIRAAYADPKTLAKRNAAIRAAYTNPEVRARSSIAAKTWQAARRRQQALILWLLAI